MSIELYKKVENIYLKVLELRHTNSNITIVCWKNISYATLIVLKTNLGYRLVNITRDTNIFRVKYCTVDLFSSDFKSPLDFKEQESIFEITVTPSEAKIEYPQYNLDDTDKITPKEIFLAILEVEEIVVKECKLCQKIKKHHEIQESKLTCMK